MVIAIYRVFDCVTAYRQTDRQTDGKSRKPPQHKLNLQSRGPPLDFVFKLAMLTVSMVSLPAQLICSENCVILFAVVLSQTTRVTDDRQTTSYDKSGTLQCSYNVPLTTKTINKVRDCATENIFLKSKTHITHICNIIQLNAKRMYNKQHILILICCYRSRSDPQLICNTDSQSKHLAYMIHAILNIVFRNTLGVN